MHSGAMHSGAMYSGACLLSLEPHGHYFSRAAGGAGDAFSCTAGDVLFASQQRPRSLTHEIDGAQLLEQRALLAAESEPVRYIVHAVPHIDQLSHAVKGPGRELWHQGSDLIRVEQAETPGRLHEEDVGALAGADLDDALREQIWTGEA
jgi:hypothetical protein